VFANFSMIIFNPGAFTKVIECACNATFEYVYPQCVDCFEQTNQTALLNTPDAAAVVNGMRKVCAVESTLMGGASTTDDGVTATSSIDAPTATATTSKGKVKVSSLHFAQLLWGIGSIGLGLGLV